jgi:hypothetical protein
VEKSIDLNNIQNGYEVLGGAGRTRKNKTRHAFSKISIIILPHSLLLA